MIKTLRRKFVLINMSLVALVLLIVFSALCYSDYRQAESEGLRTLELALDRQTLTQPPKLGLDDRRVPDGDSAAPWQTTFVVLAGDDGAVLSVTGQGLEVDDELAEEAAAAALATGLSSGRLGSLDLRFLLRETHEGTKIAFYDLTAGQRSMRNLILTSLGAFSLALAAFYGISLFLSKLALAPVERAWEQQRRFVADASHELKTPLTVILANTGILLSHRSDTIDDQSKWVENTRAEAERMKGLVEDMLFLARSDDGRAPAPRTRVDFSDLILSCTLPFEAVAFERGVTLESTVEPNVMLTCDTGGMKQLTAILLDNACKYAGEGGTVRLTLAREGERLCLSVFNTGEGIPPEKLAHVFERFYRADEARSQGGFGLGLAIAQRIAENHGGRITAESDENGTTFTLTIPLKR